MSKDSGNKVDKQSVGRDSRDRFEETVMPYLSAAYNLARWLMRNEQDAEDMVQESYLRALRSFHTFQTGRDGRAWLLTIVRNTCHTWMLQNRPREMHLPLDENRQDALAASSNPETALIEKKNSQAVREALESIPFEYREVLILREWEELSYKEIAQIVDVPLGTVMSRLSRGRRELHDRLRAATPEIQS
jgi:RNA polymerase sigma factor (sigma-70 family)